MPYLNSCRSVEIKMEIRYLLCCQWQSNSIHERNKRHKLSIILSQRRKDWALTKLKLMNLVSSIACKIIYTRLFQLTDSLLGLSSLNNFWSSLLSASSSSWVSWKKENLVDITKKPSQLNTIWKGKKTDFSSVCWRRFRTTTLLFLICPFGQKW